MTERAQRRLAIATGALLVGGLSVARLLPPLAVVLSLPFVYLLAFKPVLRRLALGHIARRPRETALVLLGSLLGTAIITGSFIVGDTLDASILRGIHTQLGPVDAVVTTPGDLDVAERAMAGMPPSEADGVVPVTTATVTVSTTGEAPVAEPFATVVELDFARAGEFGGDPDATGISGATPSEGEAVLGEDLAARLDAAEGDLVRLYAYGDFRDLRVVDVLPQVGLAGLQLNGQSGSSSPTIFVRPGLTSALATANPGRGEPPVSSLLVSAPGGVDAVAEDSAAFEAAIRRAAATADPPVEVNVLTVKQDLREAAKAVGDSFTQLFGLIGLFSVLAGVLLLVNIFVMLAQERQSELGMLRAVGLRRSGLVGSFSLEGWMYALGSAALGTAAGVAVGRVIVLAVAGLFRGGEGDGEGGLDLVFTASRESASAGFLFGFVISLVTVVVTSVRISRLNVISAIRELPDAPVARARWVTLAGHALGAVAVVLGLVATAGAIANESGGTALVAPCLVAAGAVRLFGGLVGRRLAVSVAGAAVLAWAIGAFSLFPSVFGDAAIAVFVVQGVILVGAAVALLSQNQEIVGAVVRRAGGGSRNMSLRLGLAYPLARRFRTGMTLTMYALVVYMLATITIFGSLFNGQIESFTRSISGGFDLIVDTNGTNPIPLDELRALPEVEEVAAIASAFGEYTPTGGATSGRSGNVDPVGWPAATFDETFIARRAPDLSERDPAYATDADAYRAVLADPNLFIPTEFFLEQGGGPPAPPRLGERFVLRDPLSGRSRTLTVAAVATSGFGSLRPLMSAEAFRSVFGDRVLPNVFYVRVATGVAPDAIAVSLNARFVANGTNAASFDEIVARNLSEQQGFLRLMRGYLALGLVVGIAGLGVVMVRAVRERRREVGVLRALGFDPVAVRRAFVAESAFVALEGVLTGTLLAVVTSWRLTSTADFGGSLVFRVPWLPLAVLVAGTMVASLLATAAPAQQAARIRPAVALRIAD